jgi:flagellar biosynthesis/type III secretory pathway protein FliH
MARVIRAQRSGPSVVPGEVYDARREAEQILEQARAEAEALRIEAIAEGKRAGRLDAAKQLFDVAAMRSELIRNTEQQALRAVLLVAAELVGSTLRSDPAQIAAMLAPHLQRLRRAASITLRLHPEDAHFLERNRAQLAQRAGFECPVELVADPTISRGGCVVDSNLGELDARIETRLAELGRALGLKEVEP